MLYYDDIKAVSSGKTTPEFVVTSQEEGVQGDSDAKTNENRGEESSAATAEPISWTRYLIPLISGGITLAAAAAAILLALDRKRR